MGTDRQKPTTIQSYAVNAVTTDTNQNITGIKTFTNNSATVMAVVRDSTSTGTNATIEFRSDTASTATKSVYAGNGVGNTFGIGASNNLATRANNWLTVTADGGWIGDNQIWHAGNFGSWQTLAFATGNVSINSVTRGRYLLDTTAIAGTLVLPSGPSPGDTVAIQDAGGKFGTNNLTISRNNQRIVGLTEDLVINQDNAGCELVYVNATRGWVVFFT